VNDLLQSLEGDDDAVESLLSDLQRADETLSKLAPASTAPRVGPAADGDGRAYVDHARDIGAFNPAFPEYTIEVDGPHATGTVEFPLSYEGPPGIVHGGFLAVFFDCVVQHHNCDVGVAGKTTGMALRYRRPAPLLTPLTFSIQRAEGEGRIHSVAMLEHDGRLLCEADIDAIAGNRANLPEVSPRRSPA
jgi:hypothetical protein